MSAASTADNSARSADHARRLEDVCDRFERAWADGPAPRLEDYLGEWDEPGRSDLARELIHLEVFHRRRRGEECRTDDYRARFPDLDATWLAAVVAGAASTPAPRSDSAARTAVQPDPTGGDGTPASGPDRLPRSVGDYEVLEELARGGMGVVYRARHVGLNRVVALKMILAGQFASADDVRRFRLEAEAAAHLDHPGIVPIYDVGERNGLPYFSMKLIEGGSLARRMADFCLPTTEQNESVVGRQSRIAHLVAAVARAVHHAHQRGVLHRDLKPGNILLDERGEPHVTDFGLAKRAEADAGLTATGVPVGTASYMPPEQARGERQLTTAADVYSLGAVLYELLTGRPPFRGSDLLDTLRMVQESEPVPPRRQQPLVDRDLEAVGLKCLEKDPARRYASAEALADDLDRYRRHEPVLAVPPTAADRVRKFVRRHKGPVVAAALVFVTLVGGIVGTTVAMLRARSAEQQTARERDEAVKQKRRTRQALDTMLSKEMVERLRTQKELTDGQKTFLQTALTYYKEFATEAATDAESRKLEADAHFRIGNLLQALGHRDDAVAAFRSASSAYRTLGVDYPDWADVRRGLADSHNGLGLLLKDFGLWAEAEAEYRAALAERARLTADAPEIADYRSDLAAGHNNLGVLLEETGRRPEAAAVYRDALNAQGSLVSQFPDVPNYRRVLAMSHNNLGAVLAKLRKPLEAEASFRAALAEQEQLTTKFPAMADYRADLARTQSNLGVVLRSQNKNVGAEDAQRASLIAREKLVVEFPAVAEYRTDLANSYNNLGLLLRGLGRTAEADAAQRAALAARERLAADNPAIPVYAVNLCGSYCNFGNLLRDRGEAVAALEWHTKAIDRLTPVLTAEPRLANVRQSLRNSHWGRAQDLVALSRYTEALTDWDRGLDLDTGPGRAALRLGRADCLVRLGRWGEAFPDVEEVIAADGANIDTLVGCAGVLSVLSAAPGNPDSDGHAARAVTLLRQVLARDRRYVPQLLQGADLAPLRKRADFAALTWDLVDAPVR